MIRRVWRGILMLSGVLVLWLCGCRDGSSARKHDHVEEAAKRAQKSLINQVENENKAAIEQLEEEILLMKQAIDAKAAEDAAFTIALHQRLRLPSVLPHDLDPKLRAKASNNKKLQELEKEHDTIHGKLVHQFPDAVRKGVERAR